jgi:hypothetical protein
VLTDDISGMTYVARWIKTGFLEEVPEGLSWDEITKLAKNYEREWQGLTDEEKVEIQALKWWDWEDTFDLDGYTRAIEAKLKEKNT